MEIIIICPHCIIPILIMKNEINCAIFRHGVLKKSKKQINPHASKEYCDSLIKNDLIYGCGKPFKLINDNGVYSPVICEYI
jgi:hypothetical protein